eukprot:2940066-Rhodomonas_salina.3
MFAVLNPLTPVVQHQRYHVCFPQPSEYRARVALCPLLLRSFPPLFHRERLPACYLFSYKPEDEDEAEANEERETKEDSRPDNLVQETGARNRLAEQSRRSARV